MIQEETILDVADNTGVKTVKMIRALGHVKRYAGVGDVIKCAVQETTPDAAIKEGVINAVIIRTRSAIPREDGSYLKFDDNAVVIIDANKNPKGTRVFGPVARELRADADFMKILSLAPEVL